MRGGSGEALLSPPGFLFPLADSDLIHFARPFRPPALKQDKVKVEAKTAPKKTAARTLQIREGHAGPKWVDAVDKRFSRRE